MIPSKPCRLNLNLESHMSLCFFEYCAMYILGIILNKISNIYVVLKISREIIFIFEMTRMLEMLKCRFMKKVYLIILEQVIVIIF